MKEIDTLYNKLWAEIRKKINNEFVESDDEQKRKSSSYASSLQKDVNNSMDTYFNQLVRTFNSELTDLYLSSYNRTNNVIADGKTQPKAKTLTGREVNNTLNTARNQDITFSTALENQSTYLSHQISDLLEDMYKNKNNVNANSSKIQTLLTQSKSRVQKLLDSESEYFTALGIIDCCKSRDLTEYIFVAIMDTKTSQICKSMHLKKLPVIKATPHVNMPPMHDNCRSSVMPFDKIHYERMKTEKKFTNPKKDDTLDLAFYTQWVFEYVKNYSPEYMRKENTPSFHIELTTDIHDLLDIAGFIPALGDITDLANLIIYLFEADILNATISALSLLPYGDMMKSLKKLHKTSDVVGITGKKVIKSVLEEIGENLSEEGAERLVKEAFEETAEKLSKEIGEEAAEKTVKEVTESTVNKVGKETTENVGEVAVKGTGKSISNGMKVTSNEALDLADDFLGYGYKDLGNGRYMSADGTRIVRMGDSDILGKHGGGPHMNFETLVPNPAKSGKMMVIENIHIYLTD